MCVFVFVDVILDSEFKVWTEQHCHDLAIRIFVGGVCVSACGCVGKRERERERERQSERERERTGTSLVHLFGA